MERSDTDKAAKEIYIMYCADRDIDQAVKAKDDDKIDRHEVDDILFDKRIADDDPLRGE